MRFKLYVFACSILCFFLVQSSATQQRAATADGDWPMYRHDYAGTGYSPSRRSM
jgi:hypothetical protein